MAKMIQPEGNVYNKYDNKNPFVKKIMAGFFSSMDSLLADLDFSNVYEAGCGEGMISEHIYELKNGEAQCYASDISCRLIENASRTFPHIHFSEGSIYDIKCEDEAFDLVFASEVLEHLDYPERAIQELFRVSKKHVFISVPNEPVWRIANLIRGKYVCTLGNTPGHVQHWSTNALLSLVESLRLTPSGGGAGSYLLRSLGRWVCTENKKNEYNHPFVKCGKCS